MYFSRSFVASVLLGLASATTHLGEQGAASQTVSASEAIASSASATVEAVSATNGPAASGAASAGTVNTHVIQVGGPNDTLVFSPSNIQAQPGDLVQFQFNPKNHSVVQSTFDQPCTPIQNVMANKTDAFFSGFMPNNRTAGDFKNVFTYTIRVMDEKPIWFYCSQGKHCQEGMVGAINAAETGNKTVAAFAALANVATENLSPGQAAGGNAGAEQSGAEQSGAPAASTAAGGEAAPTGAGATSAGASGAAGDATASSATDPAQQTTNAAPGRLSDATKKSFLGLGLGGLAAFLVL